MSDRRKASFRYFTGTGNSKRVADLCAAVFAASGWETDTAAIPAGGPPIEEAAAACFVFPVYSLDLPRIARRYLESLPPAGADKTSRRLPALLVATGGDANDFGWFLHEGTRILSARGYDVAYADLVRMPNNWGPFMQVPGMPEARGILAEGEAKAEAIARAFLAGERYAKPMDLRRFGPLGSRLMRMGFKLGVRRLWTRFSASSACTSCGLCARSCPTASLAMAEGRPRWSAGCEQCMRCFNLCPSRAILQLEAIGKGSGRERWIEPHFRPVE